jgi:hypothetical protein
MAIFNTGNVKFGVANPYFVRERNIYNVYEANQTKKNQGIYHGMSVGASLGKA